MPVAFVIRPFKVKKDSAGTTLDFDRVYDELILPALNQCGIPGGDMGEIVGPGNIREDMFAKIIEAELVICDVSIHNANVFYELGIRHALRKKRTIIIKGGPTADSTPFDILTDRYVSYDLTNPGASVGALVDTINASRATDVTDSPILNLLQDLPEADPTAIQAVPPSFLEDLGRARAAHSKGWLRLLAHEVEGLRFERPGRQLVGEALWKVGDFECARETLEKIRALEPNDIPANLALANVYERLYRIDGKPETLGASDSAISRLLTSDRTDPKSRAEALALKGRNQKTRWRNEFSRLGDEAARRTAAMSQLLRDSYEAYREAFQLDLNHFYSGIAALQMGLIFLELSTDADAGWEQSFDSDREAADYRERVDADVALLRAVVKVSAEAALHRPSTSDSDRLWAGITKADLLFLGDDNVKRIVRSYMAALPDDDAFAWNAVVGQLALFASLGVRGQLTRDLMAQLQADTPQPDGASDTPLHVVVFAGHRVDAVDRTPPRLPAVLMPRAQQEIERRLKPLTETHKVVSLASGAPGGDIIFHEVCGQLGIASTVCLPMPEDSYVATVFDDLEWRSRFLKLIEARRPLRPPAIVELCDGPGLPPWLYGSPTNAWERGNRWVLEMAATWGASKVTLITLWDGKSDGDGPGGTAHMVKLARQRADVDIILIETASLSAAASV
jgi:tetratricopeptide (TPR) repeat protein